jgi:hypothetical protein
VRIVWYALATLFVLLGTLWAVDRERRWQVPRLPISGIESLRGAAEPLPHPRGVLLVPVHPGCPHCLAAWRRLTHPRPGEPDFEERVALVVDVEQRPSARALRSFETSAVWWDRRGVWRERWGHRVYGERMRFDGSGSYLGTSPPLMP